MRLKIVIFVLTGAALGCVFLVGLYNLPPVRERLAWRVDRIQTQIKYALNPPEEVVFVPQEQVEAIVQGTLTAIAPTPLPSPTSTDPGPAETPAPSPTPTLPPTSIPEKVILSGILHEYEVMNNCGPATVSMNLSFWGWQGDQLVTREYLRPNRDVDDKNVMPAEMAEYINTQTDFKALVRVGGDVDLLKRLIAAGFPVIVEKGFQPGKDFWMGHYALVNGYDDARGRFITQDSYIMADLPLPYEDLDQRWWRDFNYLYMVIYPPEREAEVLSVLGSQADEMTNLRHALEKAERESARLEGRDQFFAWYNRGTNLVALGEYAAAAEAYDQAFAIYPHISEQDRPWRMLWYQVGPYPAYYHSGRYQDVINLADTTFAWIGKPVLEETYYWRGMAYAALGEMEKAIADLEQAATLNPNSTPAREELEKIADG